MEQPKFIITRDGYFRLGMVHQHKDLLSPGETCYGGGYYDFDYINNRILLHGFSYDFGRPKWKDIPTLRLPKAYQGFRIIYQYDNGENFCPEDDLSVEYYE